jgi:hypothetical protein
MTISLPTPARLFPAISLLLMASSSRFYVCLSCIGFLSTESKARPDAGLQGRIQSLRVRIYLIRNMQGFGMARPFLCVLCMFMLFFENYLPGQVVFGLSLLFIMAFLGIRSWILSSQSTPWSGAVVKNDRPRRRKNKKPCLHHEGIT